MGAETLPAARQAKKRQMVICRGCGNNRENRGRRLCGSCWKRSAKLGHPKTVPPPITDQDRALQLQEANAIQDTAREVTAPSGWAWQDRARCRDEDMVLFFGPDGERAAERSIREAKAKAFCKGCPVLQECLDGAIGRNEKFGVWGGLDPDGRSQERRRRMRRANANAA